MAKKGDWVRIHSIVLKAEAGRYEEMRPATMDKGLPAE